MNFFPVTQEIDVDSVLSGYMEQPKACSYIAGQTRQDLRFEFQESAGIIEHAIVTQSAAESGMMYDGAKSLFEPNCPSCKKCVSIRYLVQDFRRSASQQDVWNMLPERRVLTTLGYRSKDQLDTHIAVAARYYKDRFPDHASVLTAQDTLTAPFVLNKKLPLNVVELRDKDNVLIGGSINAETEDAMIGVIYYYDVSRMNLQPGRQIVMTLLDECRKLGKEHLYVGPWNPANRHLANKTHWRPYELYIDGAWHRFTTPVPDLKSRGLRL